MFLQSLYEKGIFVQCKYKCDGACIKVCIVELFTITRQMVWSLELVGDVATLKNL